ncbi:hypothetical protein [Noviherbaspirillum sp. ST9]|uniref:hypothetical protein n=1 Tax=Noviherbaspirillum sp. ST9 TaxID=3401606 RepID=UPI003B587C96
MADRKANPFLAYPRALQLLTSRLTTTPYELAAWVFLGPEQGGLAAYRDVAELDTPSRFQFSTFDTGSDYLAALAACWFREDDVLNFVPVDRFLSGAALVARWQPQLGAQAAAFVQAKIAESRLLDMHPVTGLTRGTFPADEALPPIADALFVLTHVEKIEQEDFQIDSPGVQVQQSAAPLLNTPEWHKQNARAAAEALHNRPGGSRAKRDEIRAIWASGRYRTRDECAEQECAALGMGFSTARKALMNTPTPLLPDRC